MRHLAFLLAFARHRDLRYKSGLSPDGLPECYVYSPNMRYRYAFARWWDADGPLVLWIGVNPGKGDTEMRHRPTVRRCIDWSRKWGAGGLMFANLFAARHNKPRSLRRMTDPVGPHNDEALKAMSRKASRTIVAWGNSGQLHGRADDVAPLLTVPLCLGVTASGQPRHPLYVLGRTRVVAWPRRR